MWCMYAALFGLQQAVVPPPLRRRTAVAATATVTATLHLAAMTATATVTTAVMIAMTGAATTVVMTMARARPVARILAPTHASTSAVRGALTIMSCGCRLGILVSSFTLLR